MSRINLENNLAYKQRLLAPEFYSTKQVLTGSYVLSEESTTYQFLNPNGVSRTVFLPEITVGGQFYVITNNGGTGLLQVVDALGSPVADIGPADTAIFISSQSEWWVVASATNAAPALGIVSVTAVIDGGGSTITTGVKGDLEVPFACTVERWTMLTDTGTATVDVWRDSYANYPPVVGDSMVGAGTKPFVSSGEKNQATPNWTTVAIAAGDILRFNVDAATATRITLSLMCSKS